MLHLEKYDSTNSFRGMLLTAILGYGWFRTTYHFRVFAFHGQRGTAKIPGQAGPFSLRPRFGRWTGRLVLQLGCLACGK